MTLKRVARRVPGARRVYRLLRPPAFDELELVHRALPNPGLMVDVGAHTGGSLERFLASGWHVIAIEPDADNRSQLVGRHGKHPRLWVDPRAITEVDGEVVTLYTSPLSSGISTRAPFHVSHRPTATVESVRLDTLLDGVHQVDLLKVDTEGWDLPVLRTFPWDRLHPRVVVTEFEDRKSRPVGYGFHDLADFLVQQGYGVLVSEWYPIVEYGRRHRWRSLDPYPTELADQAAWGNLIATDGISIPVAGP